MPEPQDESQPKKRDDAKNESDSLVRLEWFQNPMTAEMAKAFLERHGIRVSKSPAAFGKPEGPAYLEVLASQVEEAKRLLKERK